MNKSADEFGRLFEKFRMDFKHKAFAAYKGDSDPLMEVFGITPAIKSRNMQYWGRQLGSCWESIVKEICQKRGSGFKPALKQGRGELCDFRLGDYGIDTKYRIGSGDSGTVNKFKDNAKILIGKGCKPILLILRTDNLRNTISQCEKGGWKVYTGEHSFDFISRVTGGFKMKKFLTDRAGLYHVSGT